MMSFSMLKAVTELLSMGIKGVVVKRGANGIFAGIGWENPAVGVGLYIDQLTSSLIRQGIPYGESVNGPDTANECET